MNRDVGRHPRPDRRPSARRRARHVNAWSMLAGLAVVLASGTGPASGRAWQEPAPAVRPPTGRADGTERPASSRRIPTRCGSRMACCVSGSSTWRPRNTSGSWRPGPRTPIGSTPSSAWATPGSTRTAIPNPCGPSAISSTRRPRSPFADRAVSRGRTLLPDRQPARRTPRPRGVHGGEGRSSCAGDGLDLPGRCPLRPERPARGAGGLRTVAGGLPPGPARRSRPIRPGADPGGVGRARPGAARVPRAGRPRRTGLGRPRLAPGRLDRARCRPAGRRRRGPRDDGAHRPLEPTEGRSPAPARPGARPSRPVRRGRTPAPRPRRRPGQPARGAGRRSSWRRSSSSTIAPPRRSRRSTPRSGATAAPPCGRRSCSGRPRPCASSTAWTRRRRDSSRSSRPHPMTPGPTTLCTAPRRRPSIARMPRRPAGYPAGSRPASPTAHSAARPGWSRPEPPR